MGAADLLFLGRRQRTPSPSRLVAFDRDEDRGRLFGAHHRDAGVGHIHGRRG